MVFLAYTSMPWQQQTASSKWQVRYIEETGLFKRCSSYTDNGYITLIGLSGSNTVL